MQLFANNAVSSLAFNITNTDTTITVAAGTGDKFPVIVNSGDYFMLTLISDSGEMEIVKVTARNSGSDNMTVERAQEGTTAKAFDAGSKVSLRVTKETLEKLRDGDSSKPFKVGDAVALNEAVSLGQLATKADTDLNNVLDQTILDKLKNVDGDGSGLDADTVDGKHASDLADVDLSNVADNDILTKLKNIDGAGSGLDTDLVRGLPADFSCSKNQNGYTKLPNGLIIQWGREHSTYINPYNVIFPIAFPNTVFSGVATIESGWSNMIAGKAYNWSKTGFTFYTKRCYDDAQYYVDFFRWIAIGC